MLKELIGQDFQAIAIFPGERRAYVAVEWDFL